MVYADNIIFKGRKEFAAFRLLGLYEGDETRLWTTELGLLIQVQGTISAKT